MQIAINKSNNLFELNSLKVEKIDNDYIEKAITEMTEKEKLMKAKSLILLHKKSNRIICELNMIQNQHFYPLSILDYANLMLRYLKKEITELPIVSLDSHDYNFCDFNCKDCLAVDTRKWAQENLNFNNFNFEHYKKVLKEISRYSRKRGCDSIRFEMSGEGNPDMYPYRAEIIKYAVEECNMKPVYISSGSMMNEELIETLAKYAYYVRISLPGTNNKSYDIYSGQKKKEPFTFDNAIDLIKRLSEKRKQFGREGTMMIGARTCMRPENEGSYISTAKKLGEIGADSFQIVKILVPIGEKIEKYPITENVANELIDLKKNYDKYNLLHIQIPRDLDYIYYDRKIEENVKPSKCYSSMLSPILYGPNLVICTHWEKIKDIEHSHYGLIKGEEGEMEQIMTGKKAEGIRKEVPERCSSCCSIFDNQMMEVIRAQLALATNLDDVEFLLTY